MEGYAKTVYLSLGSNQGDRERLINRALEALTEAGLTEAGLSVLKRSSLYETAPVETASGRWFLNCVAEVQTTLMPLGLLRLVQRIERQLGRRPRSAAQPLARTIDIDILLFGQSRVGLPELTIPHPRLPERRFVLIPLKEVAPELRHPVTQQTPGEMLTACSDTSPVRLWHPD